MTTRKLILLPLLALAGTALSGCVAVAIPALAGSAVVGSRVIDTDEDEQEVATGTPPPAVMSALPAAPETAMRSPAPPPPQPQPQPQPPATTEPDTTPAAESSSDRSNGFAHLVRYARAMALSRSADKGMLSAILRDPVALDGQRRRCAPGEQPVVLIDLDPAGGVFTSPSSPARQQGTILGLAVLREAGVVIAWISDLSVDESGTLRTVLEQSGFDPRGEDIISLRRDGDDPKPARRENLAATSCIIAIAGDERPDFDDRFRYLKNPAAGAALETLIGDGWFFTDPLLSAEGDTAL